MYKTFTTKKNKNWDSTCCNNKQTKSLDTASNAQKCFYNLNLNCIKPTRFLKAMNSCLLKIHLSHAQVGG